MSRYYAICEVKEKLSVTTNTVNQLIRSGLLPAFSFAGEIRIRESDLLTYEKKSKIEGE